MAYENYTVNQFKSAWFSGDRTVMNDEEFNTVYTEYIDTSGLYEHEELEKVLYITFLSSRVNCITIGTKLERDFVKYFDCPFLPYLEKFKDFGHFLIWNDDKEYFLKQLDQVELREKHYISELEDCIKSLFEFREKKNNKEETIKPNREAFIRTINSLGKLGFRIDGNVTTVEELAFMIKQQMEENERIRNDNDNLKNKY